VLGAGLVAKPYSKLSLFLDYNATLNSQQTTQPSSQVSGISGNRREAESEVIRRHNSKAVVVLIEGRKPSSRHVEILGPSINQSA